MTRFKLLSFLSGPLLGLVLAACSPVLDQGSSPVSRSGIVGGTEADESTPGSSSVVLIYGETPEVPTFLCTGTFISDEWILTAAHCAPPERTSLSVFFGIRPFEKGGQELNIKQVVRLSEDDKEHKAQKSRDNKADLALIRFTGGLPAGAVAAALPEAGFAEREILALGYGRVHGVEGAPGETGSGLLRFVSLPVIAGEPETDQFRIDQTPGQGVCFGDSGGPALATRNKKITIVVVASAVFSPGDVNENVEGFDHCRQRSLYNRVDAHLGWIRFVLGQRNK